MQIVFLIKPYAVDMYSLKDDIYTLLGIQNISRIDNEPRLDYENRMIYVCKDLCQDFVRHDMYKQNKKDITHIKVILTNPWCIYEIINLEKEFDKEQAVTQKLINSMIVHRMSDDLSIIKNDIFNIILNGYNVQKINNQSARFLHIQYLSIYSSSNFLNKIKNTLETIFHLHDTEIDSIYSYINSLNKDNIETNELKIIIEDNSLDLSYIHNGRIVSTFLIPCGCVSLRDKLKSSLHIDDLILDKILKSRLNTSSSNNYNKSLENVWADLSNDLKNKINQEIDIHLSFVKTQIKNFIDLIDSEFMNKEMKVNIYSIDEDSLFSMGYILADDIKKDNYILDKLLTNELNIFTKKIF